MTVFISYLATGLVAGAIYALMASGLVLSYSASGVLNFAQGAVGFVVAVTYFELNTGLHWPIVPSAIVAIGLVGPLLGLALHRLMFDRLSHSGEIAQIVATIGLLVALPSLVLWLLDIMINDLHWALASPVNQASAPGLGPNPPVYLKISQGIQITSNQLVTFIAAALVAVLLWAVLTRSRIGLSMRATSDRREMATLRGIDPSRSSAVAWMLSSGLAGLAGVLAAPVVGLDANGFTLLLVQSATAAVFAAFRSIPLTFVFGLALGVVQNLVAGYAGFAKDVVGFSVAVPILLLFIGLLVRNRSRARVAGSVSEDTPPPDYLADLPRWRRLLPWAVAVVVLLVYVFLVGSRFWVGLVAQGLALSIVFMSFVVVTGLGGMVSFAQATFVSAAALTAGLLYANGVGFFLALLAGVAVAVLVGTLVALPALRLGGRILALATLAVALLGDYMVFRVNTINNQTNGWEFPALAVGPLRTDDPRSMVLLLLVVNGLVALLVANLNKSASGRAILAVRSAPAAASTSGVSITRTKLMLFALSAGIAGLGGIFYAIYNGRFGYTDTPALSGFVWLAVVVLWGVRRPTGALVAGLLGSILPQLFTDYIGSPYIPAILFGTGGILLSQQPDGAIAQMSEKRYLRRLRKRQAAQIAQVEAEEHAGPAPAATVRALVKEPAAAAAETLRGSDALLELRKVRAGYGEVAVLKDVDLVVPEGKLVAVLGANGAGKSTLCKVAAGQLTPTGGSVLYRGEDVTKQPTHHRVRDGMVHVPEARGIFPGLSVEDNLSTWLPARADREQVYERYPVLRERRKLAAGVLSGGEQQILSLAPLLVRPPQLLIADEPSLGLAPRIVDQIFQLFGEFRTSGVTILLAAEKPTEALTVADYVVLMSVGRIVWEGPANAVDNDALVTAYLGVDTSAAPKTAPGTVRL
jgi:ABC-type branched-subunit amino acid transport system ATPase component/branched-subunit amino acid ABC-type transport system permease component